VVLNRPDALPAASARLERREVLADLQPQREDQEEALQAGRERGLDAEARGKRGIAQQPGPQQWRGARRRRGVLRMALLLGPGEQHDAGHPGRQHRPHPARPAELTALEQRVDDRDHPGREHRRAGVVRPPGRAVPGSRMNRRPAISATAATGTFTKNTARHVQPNAFASVSTPPSTSPIAAAKPSMAA
jgi:hypothetical protein